MSRHLRFQSKPWATHHVTSRCIRGYHLMKPTTDIVSVIIGVLTYSLHVHKDTIKLHHYVFLSNHFHLLLSSKDTHDLARFMCHFKSNLARELGRIVGWSDTFWQKRYFSEEILDEEALIEVFKYITQNSVKEGLVDHPSEWKGAHGYHQLVEGQLIKGKWLNRTKLYHARIQAKNKNKVITESDFRQEYELILTPPPIWARKTPNNYRKLCKKICTEAIREGLTKREGPALGMIKVLAEPMYQARLVKSTFRPLCRCKCFKILKEFKEAYYTFKAKYQEASAKLRESIELGLTHIQISFPLGGIPLFGAKTPTSTSIIRIQT